MRIESKVENIENKVEILFVKMENENINLTPDFELIIDFAFFFLLFYIKE